MEMLIFLIVLTFSTECRHWPFSTYYVVRNTIADAIRLQFHVFQPCTAFHIAGLTGGAGDSGTINITACPFISPPERTQ